MGSVAILAGGRASRFGGRDKSALVVGGRTILERQIAELSAVTDDLLIVGDPGARRLQPSDPRRLQPSDPRTLQPSELGRCRRISDIVPGCGPLGGLHAALSEARDRAVFLVACDMPYVTARLAAHMLALADEGAADIVVPRTERGYHPLCAVYTRACLEPVTARLADRRLRMRDLIDEMRVRVVTAEDIDQIGDRHRLLANVNTPAEYAGLEPF
jgi:molybdopterin-guanine dinucleotide biosynthesis protein A